MKKEDLKFITNVLLTIFNIIVIAIGIWLFISFIEVVSKNLHPGATYNAWNFFVIHFLNK